MKTALSTLYGTFSPIAENRGNVMSYSDGQNRYLLPSHH